jgi:plasmid stabilization system protein ParE
MAGRYNVNWTAEAKGHVDQILVYLKTNWGENECKDFLDILFHFENTISAFPKSFKESKKFKGCRLGFVHRHITAI